MGSFHIGAKAPRTRLSQQKQVFAIAGRYGIRDELTTIASEILGRKVESLSADEGFTDREMFVLWSVMRGSGLVNKARLTSSNKGNLEDMANEVIDMLNGESDSGAWPNL